MPQDETSLESRRLCPICDLLHGHETELEWDEAGDPAVRCPCPACKVHNRQWRTVDEYEHWLRVYMPAIQDEAARKPPQQQPETEADRAHRHNVEEMCDERQWDIGKQKQEGTYQPKSAWGKWGPPD
jgi:hypothetical protein